MKKVSKNVLDQIKKEGVKPRPKWEFLLKNWALWGGFVVSLIVGAVAVSVIIFLMRTSDFDVYRQVGGLWKLVPYFWVVILLLLGAAAYYNYKNTEGGYKYHFSLVIIISVLLSVILGSVFFRVGVGKWVQNRVNVHRFHEKVWMNPDDGFLSGKIEDIVSAELSLEDLDGKKWDVYFEDVKKPPMMRLDNGMMIKIIGEKRGEFGFDAKEIRPWERGVPRKLKWMRN